MGDKPGDGQALKTVNQLLCGIHIAAAAEAMALADALGLDQAKTLAAWKPAPPGPLCFRTAVTRRLSGLRGKRR